MKFLKYIALSALAISVFASCRKIESLPDTPYIEFRNFEVFDTTDILGNYLKGGRLKFYFEDGDGDIGLKSPTEFSADTLNMFFKLYRKTRNAFIEVPDNDPMKPSGYRIPYMERTGQNKILNGTIQVTFMYLFYDKSQTDTLKYKFCIKDRAQHLSDTVYTNEIPLSVNGIY